MNPVNAIVNIFIPVVILLGLSSEDRLGVVPALLLAIGIPAVTGIIQLARERKTDASAIMGIISVLLTGVIGVFELSTRLFALKEAAIPIGFALVLIGTNGTKYPIVTLLVDMVQRRDRVLAALVSDDQISAYRTHVQATGRVWAGIMALNGVLKFILASVVVTSPAGTEAFNHELAFYELVQLPTTFTLTGVLILALIWYIVFGTGQITGLEPGEILRGGVRTERVAKRFAPIARMYAKTPIG